MEQMNLVGQTKLGYTVRELLGSGAFGTVYKVDKTIISDHYVRALKHIAIPTEKQYYSVLNSMGGNAAKADNYFSHMLENIVSEIKILSRFCDKHIVRYYENDIETIESPKRYNVYILMEYLNPLDDYIQSRNFLVRDVVKLGLDVLKGLKTCHDMGVIHRDIKDDNIFVSDDGDYKIGDFGVSKVLKDSSKAESMKGTPNFLAPEVFLGKESYTKSVDLYSLGIVLYRLLNYERNPFLPQFPEQYFDQNEEQAFNDRMKGKIPNLPSLGGEAIGQVVLKAISGSKERFQSADEFMEALESACKKTSDLILDQSIRINTGAVAFQKESSIAYGETIGESVPQYDPIKEGYPIDDSQGATIGDTPSQNGWKTSSLRETSSSFVEKGNSTPRKEVSYGETIGESISNYTTKNDTIDEMENPVHKGLFETIGETVPTHSPEKNHYEINNHSGTKSIQGESTEKKAVSSVKKEQPVKTAPSVVELKETPAVDKNILAKFAYALPFILVIIAIVALNIIIPKWYAKGVSIIEWLFSGPQNILDTLRDAHAVLPTIGAIIGFKIVGWLWLAGFIASLYYLAKTIQNKPKVTATNAILKNKEPYLMIMEVNASMKQLKTRINNKNFHSLLTRLKQLEEKLSVESNFGYGDSSVINCENNIAEQIQFLVDMVSIVEKGNLDQNLSEMEKAVSNVRDLLKRRTELKIKR